MKSFAYWTMTVLAALIGLYGLSYLVLREAIIPDVLVESFGARPWGIYPHALFGGLALLLGPLQFHPRVQRHAVWHRRIGLTYVIVALLVGTVGLYMAIYSYGGLPTHAGFGLLGLLTLVTTSAAYRYARAGEYRKHREWVVRSFAMIFAAPTQRLWLGSLIAATQGNFDVAYPWSSWLCWTLNLIVAEWLVRRSRNRPLLFGGEPLAERTIEREPARVAVPA